MSLTSSHLCIFVFVSIAIADGSKKNIAVIYVRVFLYFMVSGLPCRSLFRFEFMLVYGVKRMFSVHSFICSCPVSPALVVEQAVFSIVYSFVID